MALQKGTSKTGVIVRTPEELDLAELSHFFIGSIYHYWFENDDGDLFVLVEDFQFTIDELMVQLKKELDERGLVVELQRNEI